MARRIIWLVFVLALFGAWFPAQAQGEERVFRFYLVDTVEVVLGGVTYNAIEHFGSRIRDLVLLAPDPELVGVTERGVMSYGIVPAALVYANTTDAEDAYLDSLNDVVAIGSDTQIDTRTVTSGNRPRIVSTLQAKNIPAVWVTIGDTFRVLLRELAGYFQIMQRFQGVTNNVNLFSSGVTPQTTFGAAAVNNWQTFRGWFQAAKAGGQEDAQAWDTARQQAIAGGATQSIVNRMTLLLVGDMLGYNVTAVQGSTTIETAFRWMAAVNGGKTFIIGNYEF